ncbi:hypothetical protein DIZ76_015711 [Coccidioides immitis]|uniref:Uncharacterized protein n=1 Tax=Coccidioides immitis RMSCC 2394 TaxID=404692 RepID=A0A0J6Y9R3_COCIT|nr:hypothetical protein CIRG_05097 [Coccidioides immitis RMSCC 2394]TPX21749.1 hypothetical protein DIZ76_015711 [Coccidioides immitis]
MTAALPYLRALRKSDLLVLAEVSDLKDYDDYKKPELEAALDEHLSANRTTLSKEQRLSDYYRRLLQPPRSSPIKREPKPDGPSGLDDSVSPSKRMTRSRRPLKPKQEVEATDESESGSASQASRSPSASAMEAHTPSRPALGFLSSLPPSPAVVTVAIEEQTTKVRKSVSDAWVASGLKERAYALRSCLSSVSTIESLILMLEIYGLGSEILPFRYLTTIPPMPNLYTPAIQVKIPDVFALLTGEFWAPFSLWLTTSVILPSIFAYFFNISLKMSQPQPPSHSYGTRRASAAQAAVASSKTNFDPLVFNVSKALVSYLVYANKFTFWDVYNPISVRKVSDSVPGGLPGLLTGSALCVLGSLYEAILRK